jgi:hypothetical protein
MITHRTTATPFLALLAAGALLAAPALAPDARAGDSEWATAGKILTGVLAVDLLFNHLPAWRAAPRTVVHQAPMVEHRYLYVSPPPVPVTFVPPPVPVTMVPPPPPRQVAVAERPAPPPGALTWHDGHYIYVPRQVWVDTTTEVEEWVQGHRRADGVWVDGHKVRRRIPGGYWQTTEEKVWVEPHWE